MSAMRSLKARISGPNARPVAQLVTMGERASRRVQDSFQDFLAQRVKLLEELLAGLKQAPASQAPSAWRNFFTIVRDLRGSSALAQNRVANQFCTSFETLLLARDPGDQRMFAAVQSHIDALGLIADGRAGDAQAQDMLASHLARAVDALPVKVQDFRAGS